MASAPRLFSRPASSSQRLKRHGLRPPRAAEVGSRAQVERIVALEAEVADAGAQISRLREEGDRLQDLLVAERDGRERDQAAWLLQLDKARQELKILSAEKNTLITQVADMRDTIANQRITLARKEQHEADLESRILALGQDIAQLRQSADERSEQLRLESERALHAESARDEVARSLELSKTECAALRDRENTLRLDRERLTTENARLHVEIAAVQVAQRHLEDTLRIAVSHPTGRPGD